jgi:crotonobetainyl-CoA:carnitine CoA-transferase CaiB-like acyl-CoA transferase
MSMPHTTAGTVGLVASPLRLSKTPPEYRHSPPLLGEHTDTILSEMLNIGPAELGDLRKSGVIG